MNADRRGSRDDHPAGMDPMHPRRAKTMVFRLFVALVGCLLIAGCYDMKKVFWAPNGQVAALIVADTLYFCDAKGELAGPFLTNAYMVAWFSNSQDLLLETSIKAKTWADFTNTSKGEWVRQISTEAASLVPRLKAGESSGEVLDNLKESKGEGYVEALWLCWRDCHGSELAGIKEHEELIKDREAETCVIQRMRYADKQLSKTAELFQSIKPCLDMRLSPDGKWFTTTGITGPLCVASATEPGAPVAIETNQVSCLPDWSPDGRSLVFIKADGASSGQSIRLGVVTRRVVLNDHGALIATNANEDLAGLIFDDTEKVRCLKDGRIVFSSIEVKLPATAREMPQREQLYAIDPERYQTVIKLIPQDLEGQVPQKWVTFEVSPDSKRISAELDNGGVIIYELASGKVETVQSDADRKSSGITPVWKSAEELCFAAIATEPTTNQLHRLDLAVWKEGKTQILSDSWPTNVINKFFNTDNAAEQLPPKK
jgi:hypothetical protein